MSIVFDRWHEHGSHRDPDADDGLRRSIEDLHRRLESGEITGDHIRLAALLGSEEARALGLHHGSEEVGSEEVGTQQSQTFADDEFCVKLESFGWAARGRIATGLALHAVQLLDQDGSQIECPRLASLDQCSTEAERRAFVAAALRNVLDYEECADTSRSILEELEDAVRTNVASIIPGQFEASRQALHHLVMAVVIAEECRNGACRLRACRTAVDHAWSLAWRGRLLHSPRFDPLGTVYEHVVPWLLQPPPPDLDGPSWA